MAAWCLVLNASGRARPEPHPPFRGLTQHQPPNPPQRGHTVLTQFINPLFFHLLCPRLRIKSLLEASKKKATQSRNYCVLHSAEIPPLPAQLNVNCLHLRGVEHQLPLSACIFAIHSLSKASIFIYRLEIHQDFQLFHSQSLLVSPITMPFPREGWKTGPSPRNTKFSTRGDTTNLGGWLMWMNDALLKYLSFCSINRLCQTPGAKAWIKQFFKTTTSAALLCWRMSPIGMSSHETYPTRLLFNSKTGQTTSHLLKTLQRQRASMWEEATLHKILNATCESKPENSLNSSYCNFIACIMLFRSILTELKVVLTSTLAIQKYCHRMG